MSELWDAPNQQAVGLDPPWVEGTGGSEAGPAPTKASKKAKEPEPDSEENGAEDEK